MVCLTALIMPYGTQTHANSCDNFCGSNPSRSAQRHCYAHSCTMLMLSFKPHTDWWFKLGTYSMPATGGCNTIKSSTIHCSELLLDTLHTLLPMSPQSIEPSESIKQGCYGPEVLLPALGKHQSPLLLPMPLRLLTLSLRAVCLHANRVLKCCHQRASSSLSIGYALCMLTHLQLLTACFVLAG